MEDQGDESVGSASGSKEEAEDKCEAKRKSTSEASPEVSFLEVEKKLDSHLDKLLQHIQTFVSSSPPPEVPNDTTPQQDGNSTKSSSDQTLSDSKFEKLHDLAAAAHRSLYAFGNGIEMCLTHTGQSRTVSTEKREGLRTIGRTAWMAVRSHPHIFRDHSSSQQTPSQQQQHQQQPPSNRHQAAASGYIRAIAARLVLIDYIRTLDITFPTIQPTDRPQSTDSPPSSAPSSSELEFGLRSFVRAGRAILSHATDPPAAYATLALAADCWELLSQRTDHQQNKTNDVANANIEHAFDAYALLPDAASLLNLNTIGTNDAPHDSPKKRESAHQATVIGSQHNVIQLLKQLQDFSTTHDNTSQNDQQNSSLSTLSLQRFLPCLARISYKHGNRYARLDDFENSRSALKIALSATDRCLAQIRTRYQPDSPLTDVPAPLQLIEQEMLVVSKECFYVLSHVCQTVGKYAEATKCLDQIELYIDEQRKRDERLYTETINHVKGSNNDDDQTPSAATLHLLSADLALAGPKNQDKVDITARAQKARAKARHAEQKERANLAFCRIIIDHKTLPAPSTQQEQSIDENLHKLVDLALKLSSNAPTTSTAETLTSSNLDPNAPNGNENEVFKLALTACRLVRIRRLSTFDTNTHDSTLSDPYQILISKYPTDHPKHLQILLDAVNAVLTCIQTARQNYHPTNTNTDGDDSQKTKSTTPSPQIQSLDRLGIKIAQNFFQQLSANNTKKHATTADSSSLLSQAEDSSLETLLTNARNHATRAITLYRASHDSHQTCATWCDFLLNTLSLRDSKQIDMLSRERYHKAVAEIKAIKAYSLSASGHYVSGLTLAREAFRTNQTIHNLVHLFHCGIVQRTSEKSDSEEERPTDSIILELDDAISQLLTNSTVSSEKTTDEILSVFPILSNTCAEREGNDGGFFLLAVQERWIGMFTRAESVTSYLRKKKSLSEKETIPPGGASLFCILQAYLCNFEHLLGNHEKTTPWSIRSSEALDRTLDSVLKLLRKVRDRKSITAASSEKGSPPTTHRRRKKKKKTNPKEEETMDDTTMDCSENVGDANNAGEGYALIWDDDLTKTIIGSHRDCVWIAEQTWNLAVQLMSCNSSDNAKWIASQIFAKAHDFALLSEEEEGHALTKGKLDSDFHQTVERSEEIILDFSETDEACELSSEFSAQCLLLSVANAVDNVYFGSTLSGSSRRPERDEGGNEIKDRLKRSLFRLRGAKEEFALNCAEEEGYSYHDNLLAWLALRCMVEIGDDEACVKLLTTGGLMKFLCQSEVNCQADQNSNKLLESIDDGNTSVSNDVSASDGERNESPKEDSNTSQDTASSSKTAPPDRNEDSALSHMFLCSLRAETNRMIGTAKHLLKFCSEELVRRNHVAIDLGEEGEYSLGEIQRKLIQMSSTVADVVSAFEHVEKVLKTPLRNDEMASGVEHKWYTVEELDWFAIEAYNRGLNLVFVGDVFNAERLLAVALNLIPSCGAEVKSHGSDMRNAYRGAVERKGMGVGMLSSGTGNIMRLFGGVVP